VHSFPSAFVSDAASSQSPYGNPGTATTATSVMTLAKLASAALAAAVAIGPEALFAEHTAAVARDAEHGIDIEGDLALAQVVNSTLYSLRASLSPEVEWSTSPGGLPTGERKRSFYQDGLGTNIGKTQEQTVFSKVGDGQRTATTLKEGRATQVKTAPLSPCGIKRERKRPHGKRLFAKTGSGQTQNKLKRTRARCDNYPEGGSSYYGHVFWDADVWMLPGARKTEKEKRRPFQLHHSCFLFMTSTDRLP
jgi:hypothetical protein